MIVDVPFVGGYSPGRLDSVNSQMATNLYPERQADGAKVPVVMHPVPGKTFLGSGGTGPCRGNGVVFLGKAYFVSGANLVEIDTNFAISNVGTLNTTSGRVKMAINPTQLMITDGTDGYIWNGSTFSVISDGDFPTAKHVTFLDSYFIVDDQDNSGRFFISSSNDGTAWDALDFATAESSPDDMKLPYAVNNSIMMCGERTIEPWGNSGATDFPFEPIRGSKMEIGVQAEWSVIQAGNALYWIGQNNEGGRVIYEATGFQPRVISNRDIEWELGTYSSVDDCETFTYQQGGHTFVQFNFPAADRTLVFDVVERAWHRRKAYAIGRDRASGHVYFNGANIVGDYQNSNFYKLDQSNYTDNGAVLERIRSGTYIHKSRKNVFIHRLEIEFDRGVGLTTGQGSDPQVILEISKDGGKTWGNKLFRGIGKKGEYKKRVSWSKLGVARDWLFRLTLTDPVDFHIVKATARIVEGDY